MAGFWFLVSVGLCIALLSSGRKKDNSSYAQGYWNGYRAFGEKVKALIDEKQVTDAKLRQLINVGETGSVASQKTAAVETVASPRQNVAVDNAEARFFVDTYDDHIYDDELELAQADEISEPVEVSAADVVVQAPQVVEMTPEQKAARSLRNLNIILYTASFLLVAAGALFVASSSTASVKLLSVIIIIAAFYTAGIVIYSKSKRLRPAALAFLGTGLALIPFAGLALQQYTNLSAAQSWLITSFVGLTAYFIVAVRLQNQLVSYLTMAFVLSLAGSATAASASAVVWQFVAIIGVSLAASIVAYVKPKWLPAVFSQPVERSGQIVTPVALAASLFVIDKLLITDYEVVFAVATLHYVVAWLQTRNLAHETTVRVLPYVVLGLIAWDIFKSDLPIIAFAMFMLLSFQYAFSLFMINRPGRAAVERTWITILFIVQALLMLYWVGQRIDLVFTAIGLATIGLTSLAVAMRLRAVGVGVIGLVASLILPFVIARGLFTPDLPWWLISLGFSAAAVGALLLYARWRHRSGALRYFMTSAYITYLVFATATAAFEQSPVVMMLSFASTAAILLAASYFARNPVSQIVVPFFVWFSVTSLADVLRIALPWHVIFISLATAVLLWVMAIIHGHLRQSFRQAAMLASGQVIFLFTFSAVIFSQANANMLVTVMLLLAACGSLALRWWCRTRAPHLNAILTTSYVIYFAAAFMAAALVSTLWWAVVSAVGIMLFMVASYVERQALVQIAASTLTIVTLSLVSSLMYLPMQWRPLFIFGSAAVIFYIATVLHRAYGQVERRFIMSVIAQIATFMIIFAGISGDYAAILTSFTILLSWAALSLVGRWWCRERSPKYGALLVASYPAYYFGAVLLLGPLNSVWCWTIAAGVGTVLFLAASYVERHLWLQVVAAILTLATLAFTAASIDLPVQWSPLFIFGGAAALFYLATWIHHIFHQENRRLLMATSAQMTLFLIVFSGMSGHYVATYVSFIILLVWALGSLAARWRCQDKTSSYGNLFLASYPTYYVGALLLLEPLSRTWSGTVAALVGVVLFLVASYVERQLWLQVVSSFMTIFTLMFVATLAGLPEQWLPLFIFGGAAALFYIATILHSICGQLKRRLLMAATAQITLFFIVFGGLHGVYSVTLTTFIILMVWSIASLMIHWRWRNLSQGYATLLRISYPIYYVSALFLLPPLVTLWSIIAFAIGAVMCWIASYTERLPLLVVLGDILLTITLFIFWEWMHFSSQWLLIGVASIVAAIFYAGHWILSAVGDAWRSRAQLWATWIVLLSVILMRFFEPTQVFAVSILIVALALTLAIEGIRTKRQGMIELAVYVATFGMQRVAEQIWPAFNVVFYAHWWAIIIALVAMTRSAYKRERLILAMSFVTLSSGVYALMNGGNYQLLFLIEHLALLVVGALSSKSWAIWWGIGASALAILYFLRTYTFLLLGFLGLLLIAIVVWRLMRSNTSN